jgi:peptidoglycan lytic transglycosylase
MYLAWQSFIAVSIAVAAGTAAGTVFAQDSNTFSGKAAYYSRDYKGTTASGARYDPTRFTAAHRTLPFGTWLRVTDARTQRSVTVVINDRGPFTKDRTLDLSLAAAKALHMTERGVIKVTATVESRSASGR